MEELALEIARTVHEDQNDADGRPHIEHVLRVAEGFEGDTRLAAILHDVIEDDEDGRWTRHALVEAGFSNRVAGAVDVVSRRVGESYEAFVQRIVEWATTSRSPSSSPTSATTSPARPPATRSVCADTERLWPGSTPAESRRRS